MPITINGTTGIAANAGFFSDGYGNLRGVPVNDKTSGYVLIGSDAGRTISVTTGGVWVPGNIFSPGDNIVIYNNSNTSQTITPNAEIVMFEAANTGNGGAKTLVGRGIATVYCTSNNTFLISGAGLA
jgi:pSer/pThr/pTyr-binding forkhead associated (FHA) protein